MLSYWEQKSVWECDVLIAGAGIVGLSTAASLAEAYPKLKILVVEQNSIPGGASLRNAGFACFGSFTEVLDDINAIGYDQALRLLLNRYDGLSITRKRLGDRTIEFRQVGGYELITRKEEEQLNKLIEVNEWLHKEFSLYLYREVPEQIQSFGFKPEKVSNLLYNPLEGHLNTGKLMAALHSYVVQKGVTVVYGCQLKAAEGTSVQKDTLNLHADGKEHRIRSKAIVFCTNAFSGALLPNEDIRPGRGLILVTEPISELPFKGTFHYDRGYYYFRDLGDRILLGGGRHLDVEGEQTLQEGINPLIYESLQKLLIEVIYPKKALKIEYSWTGTMAFGSNKIPIVKKLDKGLYAAIRMGGMGVAIAGKVGSEISELLKEDLA